MIQVTLRSISTPEGTIPVEGSAGRIPIDDIKLVVGGFECEEGCVIMLKSGGMVNVKDSISDVNSRVDSKRFDHKYADERAAIAAAKP